MRWLAFFFSPGRIILLASLAAAAYLAVSAGSSLLDSFRLSENEMQLRAEIDELKQQESQLIEIREYLRSDEYVEFMARQIFGLVKPGESLVVVNAPKSEPPSPTPGEKWWERLFNP